MTAMLAPLRRAFLVVNQPSRASRQRSFTSWLCRRYTEYFAMTNAALTSIAEVSVEAKAGRLANGVFHAKSLLAEIGLCLR